MISFPVSKASSIAFPFYEPSNLAALHCQFIERNFPDVHKAIVKLGLCVVPNSQY